MNADKAKRLEAKLGDLLEVLVDYCMERLQSGELSPQEMREIRQLLEDNKITIDITSAQVRDGLLDDVDEDELPVTNLTVVK